MQHFVRHFGLIFRILLFYETHQHVFLEPNKKFDLAIKIKSFFFFSRKIHAHHFAHAPEEFGSCFLWVYLRWSMTFRWFYAILCHFMPFYAICYRDYYARTNSFPEKLNWTKSFGQNEWNSFYRKHSLFPLSFISKNKTGKINCTLVEEITLSENCKTYSQICVILCN